MSKTHHASLTRKARTAIKPLLKATKVVSAVSPLVALGVAGIYEPLADVGLGLLPETELTEWLTSLGCNVLAGWVGDLVAWIARRSLTRDDPQAVQQALHDLAAKLEELLTREQAVADDLVRLLQALDALPQALDALAEEIGAQGDLMRAQNELLHRLRDDLKRLHLESSALPLLISQAADRVIAAFHNRIDHIDAKVSQILQELRALRDSLQPLTLRPVEPTSDELAEAQARLAAMPTDEIPDPQDVLPPGSVMDLTRNRQFVGRVEDLRALARLLKGGQSVADSQAVSAVTSGLGGVGKTQLAIEFVYRYGRYFAGVYWLNCEQADTLPAQIAACGGMGRLHLFTEASGLKLEEQVRLVRERWACGLPYLLIFDNCEDPDLVRTYQPRGATRVLITSRNPDWPSDLGVQRHTLGVLPRAESIALLRQHRPDLSATEADELAAELGDLPLALHLAGRFLGGVGKRIAVAAYLKELRSPQLIKRLSLRAQDGRLPTGHDRDVARTFALSYERLKPQDAVDALAVRLLARAAHLAPGEVAPVEVLRESLEQEGKDWEAQLAVEEALARLVAPGLIEEVGADGVRMHRLVAAYVRQVSDDAEAQAAVERAVLARAATLDEAETLAPLAAFLPVLRRVTDAALPREDLTAAELSARLGAHMRRLGLYTAAKPYLERALAIRERVLGAEHPDTAQSLNNLALLYQDQGEYAAARPLYERALAIRERVLGAEHPDTAQSLNNLAMLHYARGEYTTARPLYERALAICERVLGAEHPDTATVLNNLAMLHYARGEYATARPLYERALAICERVLGAEHPDTARSLNNLAMLYKAQGEYAAARPLLERALAIVERVRGAEHPDTATVLNNLALLYAVQGRYAAARPLYERALAICERVLGAEHPDTVASVVALARLLVRQGELTEAKRTLRRILANLGADHPSAKALRLELMAVRVRAYLAVAGALALILFVVVGIGVAVYSIAF